MVMPQTLIFGLVPAKLQPKLTNLQYPFQYHLILVELAANFARHGGSDKELPPPCRS